MSPACQAGTLLSSRPHAGNGFKGCFKFYSCHSITQEIFIEHLLWTFCSTRTTAKVPEFEGSVLAEKKNTINADK